MNCYDFDKTIFPKDSTATFYLWSLRRCPRALLSLPRTAFAFALMALGLRSQTRCKEIFYGFLRYLPEDMPERFWREHIDRIYPWYLAQKHPDDVVISAGPEFLLKPVAERLGFSLIASRVDSKTGKTDGLNCRGEEKVRRFLEAYGPTHVERFYSDSLSDAPMARLADESFLVRPGGERIPWPVRN